MNNYLKDKDFLKEVSELQLKNLNMKIILLDWNEKPIQEITGIVISGSGNYDGKSTIRRTMNLNLFLSEDKMNILDPNSLISINKKFKAEIGIQNTLNKYTNEEYIWFPLGTYVFTSASMSRNNGGANYSIQAKDKMCLLNGEVGGTLPATVCFSEKEEYDYTTGTTIITKPTIAQIIIEAVNHFGQEQLGKIVVSDIDNKIKKVMKWTGDMDAYYFYDKKNNSYYLTTVYNNDDELIKIIVKGQDIGYIETDFVYAGADLTENAGAAITSVLDKIKNYLGNFEYFYDLDGTFVFREIKNYMNKKKSSTIVKGGIFDSDYLINPSNSKAVYSFENSKLITSLNNNPQFNMIKNDYVIWGKRTTTTGKTVPIRYHLAIDKKPECMEHTFVCRLDPTDNLYKAYPSIKIENIEDTSRLNKSPGIIYYGEKLGELVFKEYNLKNKEFAKVEAKVISYIPKHWQVELYLRGIEAAALGQDTGYYYTELVNEVPKIYDLGNEESKGDYYQYVKETNGVNLDYFLDFIDSSTAIGRFSVSSIGRRTYTEDNQELNCVFEDEIPSYVLYSGEEGVPNAEGEIAINVPNNIMALLTGGGKANSIFEYLKNKIYMYTGYNENISISTLPIYNLEVNSRITVVDKESNINGDYIINSISIPFDVNGTMNISATRAVERL